MKKALALISALTFASASESDNELRLRPVSYNPNEDFPLEDFLQTFPRKFPRDLPPILYADDDELRIRPVSYNPNEDFPLEDFPQTFPRKFPRDLPPILYADDDELRIRSINFVPEEFLFNGSPEENEQPTQKTQPKKAELSDSSLWNIVQNWHYPLKPIPRPNPYVPFKPVAVENQPKVEEESVENALYHLGQLIKQGVEVQNREHGTVTKSKLRPDGNKGIFISPFQVKKEPQSRLPPSMRNQ